MVCLWYIVAKIVKSKLQSLNYLLIVDEGFLTQGQVYFFLHIFMEACAEVPCAFYISPGYGA